LILFSFTCTVLRPATSLSTSPPAQTRTRVVNVELTQPQTEMLRIHAHAITAVMTNSVSTCNEVWQINVTVVT
jgi:hypothetical protein